MQQSNLPSAQISQTIQQESLTQSALVMGNTITGFCVVVFPLCVVLGAYFCRKRRHERRAEVLRQQIERLERMWQINPKK